jgi:DNA-binding beta-propeller fold protein YncE
MTKGVRRGFSSAFLGVLGILAFHVAPALAVSVYGPVTGHIGNLGVAGAGNGEFSTPDGVAVNQITHDVYVVDTGNNRVEEFGASGEYLSQLTEVPASSGASVTGLLDAPTAVAIEPSTDDVYVADSGHNVVDKFTSGGVFVSQLTGQPLSSPEALSFSNPDGLAVDPTSGPTGGDLYVADWGNDLVDVFTPSGEWISDFHTPGARPWSLAVDSDGDVYVAAAGAQRVTDYAPLGASVIRIFEEFREGFGKVRTVGVNVQNNDAFLGTELGEAYQLEEINEHGERTPQGNFGAGAFSNPGTSSPGIAVDSISANRTVYAVDSANEIVDMFKLVILPTPITEGASNVKGTTATASGTVNPESEEAEASYFFEYGPCVQNELRLCAESSYPSRTPETLAGLGIEPLPASGALSGLKPETVYHYRLVAKNVDGEKTGDEETLVTAAVAVTGEPTNVRSTSATLNGLLDPEEKFTFYRFEYASSAEYNQNPESPYTHFSELEASSEGTLLVPVSASIGGELEPLEPGTTYHYRLFANSFEGYGIMPGKDEVFTTLPALPAVDDKSPPFATDVSPHEATLHGTVNPGRGITTYHVVYGRTTAYGSSTPEAYTQLNYEDDTVEQLITGLRPGITYHYAFVATNTSGTTTGPGATFTTPAVSSPEEETRAPEVPVIDSISGTFSQPATPALLPIPVFPAIEPVKTPPPVKCKKGFVKKGAKCVRKKHPRAKRRRK